MNDLRRSEKEAAAAAASAAEAAEKIVAERAAAEKASAEKAAAEKIVAEKAAAEKAAAEKAAAEKTAAEKAAAEKAAAEKAAAEKAAADKDREQQKAAEELLKRKLKAKEEQTKIAVASIQPIVVDVETDQEIEPKRKLGRIPKLFLEQEESSSKKCVKEAGDLPHVPIVEHDDKIWEGLHEKHQQRVYRFLFQLFSYSCFNCIL